MTISLSVAKIFSSPFSTDKDALRGSVCLARYLHLRRLHPLDDQGTQERGIKPLEFTQAEPNIETSCNDVFDILAAVPITFATGEVRSVRISGAAELINSTVNSDDPAYNHELATNLHLFCNGYPPKHSLFSTSVPCPCGDGSQGTPLINKRTSSPAFSPEVGGSQGTPSTNKRALSLALSPKSGEHEGSTFTSVLGALACRPRR